MFLFMKTLTPKLKILLDDNCRKGYIRLNDYKLHDNVPRPSILKIKELTGNKQLVGVEIGVRDGINAISIYNTLNIKQLFLIDPWINYDSIDCHYNDMNENFNKTIEKIVDKDNITVLKGFSSEMVSEIKDNSLDFVYIDGNHFYYYALQDLELYSKKVKLNGFICGHDLSIDSVKFAVYDFCRKYDLKYESLYPDFFIQKTHDNVVALNESNLNKIINQNE